MQEIDLTKSKDVIGAYNSIDFSYVTLSPFRSEGAKQINHPLCGCASKVIPS